MIHRDSKKYWEIITQNKNSKNKFHPTSSTKINSFFLDKLKLKKDQKILDIGCGFGRLFRYFIKKKLIITGIDIDKKMLIDVKKKFKYKNLKLINKDFFKKKFSQNYFDNIVCWASFDEIRQDKFLKKIKKILKIGGKILITGKNDHYLHGDNLAMLAEENARKKNHINYFTDFSSIKFDKNGFEVLDCFFFKKRGDFSNLKFVKTKPKYFYEYLIILKKKNNKKLIIKNKIFHNFSKTWIEKKINFRFKKENLGIDNKKIIFVSGLYRSGTSILAQIIGAHPKVFITYDSLKYPRFIFKKKINHKTIKNIIDETFDRLFYRWNIKIDKKSILKKLTKTEKINHATVYKLLLEEIKKIYKPNASIYGEKVALEWRFIPEFLRMYPKAKVIHIVRDPRDVVASYKKITSEKKLAYMNTVFNAYASMKEIKFLREYYGKNKLMIIKLEDLVQNPNLFTEKISSFLKINFDKKMLNFINFKSKNGKKWISNSSFSKKNKLFDNTHRWKKYLNHKEINFIEFILKDVMKEYNYYFAPKKLFNYNNFKNILFYLKDKIIFKNFKNYFLFNRGIQEYSSDPIKLELDIVKKKILKLHNYEY